MYGGGAEWVNTTPKERTISKLFPLYALDVLVAGLTGTLVSNKTYGYLDILSLHGDSYLSSSYYIDVKVGDAVVSNNTFPYAINMTTGSISAGGVWWYGRVYKDKELVCNAHIAASAIKALTFSRFFHTLSFKKCALSGETAHLAVLREMIPLCRFNTCLMAIAFPPIAIPGGSVSLTYLDLYNQIGQALVSNQRPLFSSFDFSKCNINDKLLHSLLPGLSRLFVNLMIPPVSLKFNNNFLTSTGVSSICRMLLASPLVRLMELSFGGNPWCHAPDIQSLEAIIKNASSLCILNVESTQNNFPIQILRNVLTFSVCPLRELYVAGTPVHLMEVI